MEASTLRIVTWNINALVPTLRNIDLKYKSYQDFLSQTLDGDIICLQETKLVETQLTKSLALVPGYESYWAFSKDRKGYSGVVTYARDRWASSSAASDCLELEEELRREGRIVMTHHGSLTVINVYVPNGGDRPQRLRLGPKLAFLRALREKVESLHCDGQVVVLVGDLNLAASPMDVHPTMDFAELFSPEEMAEMAALLRLLKDTWREKHADATDEYTVWNEKTSARAFNRGQRIDFILCSPSLAAHVRKCEILSQQVLPPKWSDHAAVAIDISLANDSPLALPPMRSQPCAEWRKLKDTFVDSKQRSIKDFWTFKAAKKLEPEAAEPSEASQKEGVAGAPPSNERIVQEADSTKEASKKRPLDSSSAPAAAKTPRS